MSPLRVYIPFEKYDVTDVVKYFFLIYMYLKNTEKVVSQAKFNKYQKAMLKTDKYSRKNACNAIYLKYFLG